MLALRALFFAVLMPGTAVVLIPWLLLRGQLLPDVLVLRPGRLLGLLLMLVGGAALLLCIRDFAVSGRGTLAPIDPPTKLVRVGFYRYVRNPMYLAVLLVLAGEALFFEAGTLGIYAAIAAAVYHLFVVLYEEPHLRDIFGAEYEDYRAAVPRWIPKVPPGISREQHP